LVDINHEHGIIQVECFLNYPMLFEWMPCWQRNVGNIKNKGKIMKKTRMSLTMVVLVAIGFMLVAVAGAQDKGMKKTKLNTAVVNLNTATAEELEQVKGIGPKLAGKIIEYRKTNGPFKRAEDIVNVQGIGAKFWEANKGRFVVETAPAPAVVTAPAQAPAVATAPALAPAVAPAPALAAPAPVTSKTP
jgi:competence protein ComEA